MFVMSLYYFIQLFWLKVVLTAEQTKIWRLAHSCSTNWLFAIAAISLQITMEEARAVKEVKFVSNGMSYPIL
jgi:hypothetical protein